MSSDIETIAQDLQHNINKQRILLQKRFMKPVALTIPYTIAFYTALALSITKYFKQYNWIYFVQFCLSLIFINFCLFFLKFTKIYILIIILTMVIICIILLKYTLKNHYVKNRLYYMITEWCIYFVLIILQSYCSSKIVGSQLSIDEKILNDQDVVSSIQISLLQ